MHTLTRRERVVTAACVTALALPTVAVAQPAEPPASVDPSLDALARRAEETRARAEAVARAPRRWAIELGAFGGAGASLHAGTGYVAGVDAMVRVDYGRSALAAGVRVAWSAQDIAVRATLPCSPARAGGSADAVAPDAPCLSLAPGGRFEARVARRFVRVGVPVSWRIGPAAWRVQPYVTFVPEVVFETREPDPFAVPLPRSPSAPAPAPPPPPPPPPGSPAVGMDPTGRPPASTSRTGAGYVPDDREDVRFAVRGLLGARVRLGPGAFFAELGYAYGTTRVSYGPVAYTHAADVVAGYRFEL